MSPSLAADICERGTSQGAYHNSIVICSAAGNDRRFPFSYTGSIHVPSDHRNVSHRPVTISVQRCNAILPTYSTIPWSEPITTASWVLVKIVHRNCRWRRTFGRKLTFLGLRCHTQKLYDLNDRQIRCSTMVPIRIRSTPALQLDLILAAVFGRRGS